jgi:calcineurin-like phosphoesterase family protein
MIWFSADFHLSHKNIIKYCNRPFRDVEEMDSTIIENLKSKLKSNDILYYLGDLTFHETTALEFFEVFKDIKIHYIIGNHDNKKVLDIVQKYCESMSLLKEITIAGQDITLCHYAMRVWNNSHFNSWQLYGHSHATLEPVGKQYDVGVDNNNFFPVSFDEIVEIMKNRPNNFNLIPLEKRDRELP